MSFTVAVNQFEGPLDLMLHLIKEKELDLFDLDIHVLTEQYLLYLNKMEEMHLEVCSEYLVELATLIEYKSKKLLPKQEAELNDAYEEDSKDRLVRRLLEYQQFKEISEQLKQLYLDRQCQLSKPVSIESEEWIKANDNQPVQGSPYELAKAMTRCLRRMQLLRPIETKYTAKEISVEDRILQITARLADLPETFSFERLLEDCHEIHETIVTFLAILDMAHSHQLYFTVDDADTIWFRRGA